MKHSQAVALFLGLTLVTGVNAVRAKEDSLEISTTQTPSLTDSYRDIANGMTLHLASYYGESGEYGERGRRYERGERGRRYERGEWGRYYERGEWGRRDEPNDWWRRDDYSVPTSDKQS